INAAADVARGNLIRGNYIGTDLSGTHALGNRTGVQLDEALNTVGGTAAGAGNLISRNDVGVAISARGMVLQGNRTRTDVSGTSAVSNRIGVLVQVFNAYQCLIGGTTAAARNLVSGNRFAGVQISGSGDDTVEGNYIGTDVTGTAALGNGY